MVNIFITNHKILWFVKRFYQIFFNLFSNFILHSAYSYDIINSTQTKLLGAVAKRFGDCRERLYCQTVGYIPTVKATGVLL